MKNDMNLDAHITVIAVMFTNQCLLANQIRAFNKAMI